MRLEPEIIEKEGAILIAFDFPADDPQEPPTREEFGRDQIHVAAMRVAAAAGDTSQAGSLADQFRSIFEVGEARLRVKEAIATCKKSKKPDAALDAAKYFARLGDADYGKAKSELKHHLGNAMPMRELTREVKNWRHSYSRDKAEHKREQHKSGLPEICVSNRELRDVSDDSIRALVASNEPPKLFLRGAILVRISIDEKRRYRIRDLNEAGTRGALARAADYYSVSKDGFRTIVNPPLDVCKDLMALDINTAAHRIGVQPLPALDAIMETPIIRADGTILDKRGYDASTGAYFAPSPELEEIAIPARPTAEQIHQSVAMLDEMIGDFPFVDDASRANALAYLFTLFLRPSIIGNVPLAIFDKPQPGTGGSLLAEALITVATGREAPMDGAPRDEEEWRKKITSTLLFGMSAVVLDNVESQLESDSLARVITAAVWVDRVLGRNETVALPTRSTVWAATGNNLELGRNLSRRCYRIRIDAKMARPIDRTEFKHNPLLTWVRTQRRELVTAVLTICRGWYAAGKPVGKAVTLGSFENWAELVGNILAFAGISGFLENFAQMQDEADEETTVWAAFLEAWHAKFSGNSIRLARLETAVIEDQSLREAIPPDLAVFVEQKPAHGFSSATVNVSPKFKLRLGKALQKRVGMRYGGGLYVERGQNDSHGGVATWRVIAGSAGSAGSVLTHSAMDQYKLQERNLYSADTNGGKHSQQLPALPQPDSDGFDEQDERDAMSNPEFN